ncbi:McrB family protein [Kaistella antarctica]|uniref:5-methylcytosine-specific restriction enzyme B n=1 Tax=Kaistella antarctica TaxID=266748 RepID=A0A3S4W6D4_9FLAO|nr:AAA family ATPase [Kaistella antarctica]SEV90939.1 EVE domain-containing protein [Kaistella antarctica]VEI01546.1 5-methylcytosine-specific restriction enzyme B [Kaistella antarctica]
MDEQIVNKIIDRYLSITKITGEPNEGYKYDAINHFQQNWNIDDPQFAKMFKKSFAKTGNLLYQNSWGFISKSVDRFPEETREMFRKLYCEDIDLKDKINTFQQDSEKILVLLKDDLKVEKFNAQQDERTISVYLGFRHPDKYSLYKSSFFKEFCSEFNLDPKSSSKESYITLQEQLPKFNEVINLREDFVSAYRTFYPKPDWDDTNLMIQNLLYVGYRGDVKGIYNGILNSFTNNNLAIYFSYLDEIIEEFSIKKGTQKCVFNVSDNQLNFTIGQKYVWCLKSVNNHEIFKIISDGQFGEKSEKFDSSINSYLNHIKDLDLLDQKQKEIDLAIKEVIDKTVRSSYLKYNNPFIERMVFDKDFRTLILGLDFSKNTKTNYWIFQGNPKYYDIVGALNANVLSNWQVAAHKDKIKIGDKVILWMTGENSGCYGLAEVTSDVGIIDDNQEEIKFYKSDFNPNKDRTGIKIIENFSANPLLWKDLKLNSILSSLKVGNQGTNFTATKEQFDEILRISQLNQNKMNHPLNQILFGCPGSGKTYSTKKLAVEIIEDRKFGNTKKDRAEILKLYDQGIQNNQIKFTTFHQSMSYEDFIEGIKPSMKGDEEGDLSYEIQSGIFKTICTTAIENHSSVPSNNFEESWEALIEIVKSKISNAELLKIGSWEYGLSSKNSLKYSSLDTPSQYSFTITKQNISDTYQNKKARPSGAFQKDMQDIVGFMKSQFNLSEYKEDDPSENEKFSRNKYVLIIDEINRGNISAIFGELITLIEDDKRLGNDEKIEVILPYSKESFGVPPNLYIIGTMNTADRSVESLDTALRRRFSFTEMKSDPEVIRTAHENGGIIQESPNINLIELIDIINKRIELLVDKDHQIGHSYFIGVNSLADLKITFKNKIIPLLEEYFFGDFGKIGLVLGDQFVETNSAQDNKKILSKFKGYEDVDFLTDKKIYTFKDIEQMTANDFYSIYNDYNDQ